MPLIPSKAITVMLEANNLTKVIYEDWKSVDMIIIVF